MSRRSVERLTVPGLVLLAATGACRGGGEPAASPPPAPPITAAVPRSRVSAGVLPPHVLVDESAEQRFDVEVPAYASGVLLEGTYLVGPAPRARLDVSVLAADGTARYEKRDSAGDSLHLELGPGRYTVVFANSAPADLTSSYGGPPWQRSVRAKLQLSYDRPR